MAASRRRLNSAGSQRGCSTTSVRMGSSLERLSLWTRAWKVVCSLSTRTSSSAARGKSALISALASRALVPPSVITRAVRYVRPALPGGSSTAPLRKRSWTLTMSFWVTGSSIKPRPAAVRVTAGADCFGCSAGGRNPGLVCVTCTPPSAAATPARIASPPHRAPAIPGWSCYPARQLRRPPPRRRPLRRAASLRPTRRKSCARPHVARRRRPARGRRPPRTSASPRTSLCGGQRGGSPVDVEHVLLGKLRQVRRLELLDDGVLLVEELSVPPLRGGHRQRHRHAVGLVERHDGRVLEVRAHRLDPLRVHPARCQRAHVLEHGLLDRLEILPVLYTQQHAEEIRVAMVVVGRLHRVDELFPRHEALVERAGGPEKVGVEQVLGRRGAQVVGTGGVPGDPQPRERGRVPRHLGTARLALLRLDGHGRLLHLAFPPAVRLLDVGQRLR